MAHFGTLNAPTRPSIGRLGGKLFAGEEVAAGLAAEVLGAHFKAPLAEPEGGVLGQGMHVCILVARVEYFGQGSDEAPTSRVGGLDVVFELKISDVAVVFGYGGGSRKGLVSCRAVCARAKTGALVP